MTSTQRGNTPAETSGTLFTLYTPPQNVIDRRFYIKKYDSARTLEAYGARLREEKDPERLSGTLVSVVEKTVQPEHVSLWLRTRNRETRR